MSGDYAYGNARLRARRRHLLPAAQLRGLVGADVAGLAAALRGAGYDVPAGPATDPTLAPRLAALVADTAARRRQDAYGFYPGRAGQAVALLAADRERAALLAAVRRAARGGDPDLPGAGTDALAEPTPRLPAAVLDEVGTAPDLPAAAAVLRRHRVPDEATADAVRQAARDYEVHADLPAVETALALAHAASTAAAVRRLDPRGPVGALLAASVDAANLLAALRHPDQPDGRPVPLLAGGRLPERLLRTAAAGAPPAAVVARLATEHPTWRDALHRWAAGGSLVQLHRDLDLAATRAALRLWTTGDPLGPGVPAAYLAAVAAEARDLGLLLAAAAGRMRPDALATVLVAA